MTPTYSLFMRQSYLDAWEDYNRSLVREDFPRWDYVVLTASNEAQAEAFRMQLQARREKGMLPRQTVFAVLPDPQGLRVGSGGATLKTLMSKTSDDFVYALDVADEKSGKIRSLSFDQTRAVLASYRYYDTISQIIRDLAPSPDA